MLKNLLIESGYPKKIGLGEAAIDAVIGYMVVFVGIALLVAIVALVGKVMSKSVPVKKTEAPQKPVQAPAAVKQEVSDELSEETVAVITAAIMAYYERENRKCEFTVKRIKRI